MDNQDFQQVQKQYVFLRNIPQPTLKSFLSSKIVLLTITILIIIGTGSAYLVLNSKTKTQPIESKIILAPTAMPTEAPTPTLTPTPSLEPTPTPTEIPTPTPTPTIIPTPTITPIPTATPVPYPPGSDYSNMVIATERGNFSIDVITIDMNGVKMITDTANDSNCGNDCPTKSLSNYISTNGGFAGINGAYFCPPDYSECASKKNSFDFPVFNSRLDKWINGANIAWNDRSIIYQDDNGIHFNRDAKKKWDLTLTVRCFGNSCATQSLPMDNLKAAIVNSPGLLENGNIIADQFPLTDKQKIKGTKGGIGFKGNTMYLVIAKNTGIVDFAYVFKALGASYALNLDGGGSSTLWLGRYIVGPGRNLPNAVVFSR